MKRKATVREREKGLWMLDTMVEGVRYRQKLGHGSRNWAKAEGDRVLEEKLAALPAPELTFHRLGLLWGEYALSGQSRKGRLREKTTRENFAALLQVAAAVGLKETDEVVRLGPAEVRQWHFLKMKAFSGDEVAEGRALASLGSKWRKAKSVFGRGAVQFYEDRGVKYLRPWAVSLRDVVLPAGHLEPYKIPPADLIERTERLGNALRDEQPWLWVVYKLAINTGMRASEMVWLRPDWLEQDRGCLVVGICRRPYFRPKGMSRKVPIPEGLAAEILKLWETHKGEYILPGSQNQRLNLICKDFSNWMRSIGWDASQYREAAHELRKLFGSRLYTNPSFGPAAAQEYLGHSSVSTTCKFYAALDKVHVPLPER